MSACCCAVDSTRPGDAELPRFFQSTGFTPSAFLLTEQGRLNMLMAGGGGYKYMRVHCMLDLVDIQGHQDVRRGCGLQWRRLH